jgi:hypothetical protein
MNDWQRLPQLSRPVFDSALKFLFNVRNADNRLLCPSIRLRDGLYIAAPAFLPEKVLRPAQHQLKAPSQ